MGLVRTAARASVATSVVGNTHRRQQQRWAQQDAAVQARTAQAPPAPVPPVPPAPAVPPVPAQPAPPVGPSVIEQLTQLGQLRDAGVLTEAEFEAQKQRVLAQ